MGRESPGLIDKPGDQGVWGGAADAHWKRI